jgi:hypothetical protein
MNAVRTIEMQCTPAELFRELPFACAKRAYEISGDQVIVHDGARDVLIGVRQEPDRHLGSLNLPMEELTLTFNEYSEDEADAFLREFLRPIMRCGG